MPHDHFECRSCSTDIVQMFELEVGDSGLYWWCWRPNGYVCRTHIPLSMFRTSWYAYCTDIRREAAAGAVFGSIESVRYVWMLHFGPIPFVFFPLFRRPQSTSYTIGIRTSTSHVILLWARFATILLLLLQSNRKLLCSICRASRTIFIQNPISHRKKKNQP